MLSRSLQLLPAPLHQLQPQAFVALKNERRVGLLAQSGTREEAHALLKKLAPEAELIACEILSPEANLNEAARNLFAV